ncbi:hypothetical protein [Salinisphaera sp. G21_0]|uniref:hypothetical protein n=1 Tax=Salinisphaera sp. G21_0 TaxID=2821094 RepID=UPI001AD9E1BF|nr:hypothetical protein [Salinisphaera sp. G21_0]MBO9481589.1 hypothetical protein [Salinisphaera sp. G21_0]
MDNRIPPNSRKVTFANQDVNQNQLAEDSGEFGGKKVSSKNHIKMLIISLKKLKNFIMKPIRDRQIKSYNQALVKARKNKDYGRDLRNGKIDKACYDVLNRRMDKAGFDKGLLKEKNSREISDILVDHHIMTRDDAENLHIRNVDLEGSPYW